MRTKSASEIVQFSVASSFALDKALSMLLDAPDVTDEHVRALLTNEWLPDARVRALANDRLRARVRKAIGRSVPLTHLFGEDGYLGHAHSQIVRDEALRQWGDESKDPRDLLYLAGGSSTSHHPNARRAEEEERAEARGREKEGRVESEDRAYSLVADTDADGAAIQAAFVFARPVGTEAAAIELGTDEQTHAAFFGHAECVVWAVVVALTGQAAKAAGEGAWIDEAPRVAIAIAHA